MKLELSHDNSRQRFASSGQVLGVWFYGTPWNELPASELRQVKSYQFNLALHYRMKDCIAVSKRGNGSADVAMRMWNAVEVISFTATLNLYRYADPSLSYLDLDAIANTYCPHLVTEAAQRLEQRIFSKEVTVPESA